ncbi:MAG: hypothetical protein L3J59_12585 [Methylococcaceae bacterium]|nr:hypothetical protein [Methylococcaceae bacterium]
MAAIKVSPFVINIGSLSSNIQTFLQADILIINIPVKNRDYFEFLLKEIEKSKIKKVLYVSSTSVYGDESCVISESDGLELTESPLYKIETLLRESKKFKITVVRFGGLIGYKRNPGKFFSQGKLVQNPDANVNLIHRDDCIGIISQIIEQQVWGQEFNCCTDTHPTKKQFYTKVSNDIGFPAPNFANPKEKVFKVISNTKVKNVLNYEFLHKDLMDITFT